MDAVTECFSTITRDNARCPHSTCTSVHPIDIVQNDTCAHGRLEDLHQSVQCMQDWILNQELSKSSIDALLSGIFIKSGGCMCKFSWETLCFISDALEQASPTKLQHLLDNWVVHHYVEALPGLWGRESIVRSMLTRLIENGKIDRALELANYISPFYSFFDGPPWVLDIDGLSDKLLTIRDQGKSSLLVSVSSS